LTATFQNSNKNEIAITLEKGKQKYNIGMQTIGSIEETIPVPKK
jgi:hypothetical protein